jgi:23S rRNA pseudouridine1911/1915/1917 synthase
MILKFNIENDITIKEYLDNLITQRLFKVLSLNPNSFIVNNQIVKNYYKLKKGDTLEVVVPVIDSSHIMPTKKDFKILYEDEYLLIIEKERDVATIPTRNHYTNSLANYVRSYYLQKGISSGIHFVNRLDMATSGIVVVAKNIYIADAMKQAISTKKYILMVQGIIKENGEIITGIEKDKDSIIKRTTTNKNNAITKYEVLKEYVDKTLISATLVTGKTHQLRVHFSSINHPIIGDKLYGNDDYEYLYLHSTYLEFIHPITKKRVEINSYPSWNLLESHQ